MQFHAHARMRSHASARIHGKPARAILYFRDKPDIVYRGKRAILAAPRKRDFKFSRKIVGVRFGKKIFRERDGIRKNGKSLLRT